MRSAKLAAGQLVLVLDRGVGPLPAAQQQAGQDTTGGTARFVPLLVKS